MSLFMENLAERRAERARLPTGEILLAAHRRGRGSSALLLRQDPAPSRRGVQCQGRVWSSRARCGDAAGRCCGILYPKERERGRVSRGISGSVWPLHQCWWLGMDGLDPQPPCAARRHHMAKHFHQRF